MRGLRIKIVEKVENKDDKVGKKEGRIEKKERERAVIEQILFLFTRENFVEYEVEKCANSSSRLRSNFNELFCLFQVYYTFKVKSLFLAQ